MNKCFFFCFFFVVFIFFIYLFLYFFIFILLFFCTTNLNDVTRLTANRFKNGAKFSHLGKGYQQ